MDVRPAQTTEPSRPSLPTAAQIASQATVPLSAEALGLSAPTPEEEALANPELSTLVGAPAYKAPPAKGLEDEEEHTEKKPPPGAKKAGAYSRAVAEPPREDATVEATLPPTPGRRRAQLIVIAVLGVVVVGVLIAALAKGNRPGRAELETVYANSFGARAPEPSPGDVNFELMDEKPCPTHQVDTCFTYKITGPKYPTRTIIYKGRDGWLVESETRW